MLSYTDVGSGRPFVLLHGIPGSASTWNDVVPRLAPARLLVPDLLGFGRSPDAPAGTHAFEQAEAVLTMLDHAAIRTAHVVGFDFGGPVAVAMQSLAPDRVSEMTLLATNLLSDTPVPLPLQIARVPLVGELAFRLMFSGPGLAAMWRGATADRQAFPFDKFRSTFDTRGKATARRIFIESLRRLKALYGPIEAELLRIDIPVTVIWGDRDPFFPVAVGERTASRFRAARWILLRGCGHFLPHEKPGEVAAAITSGGSPEHGSTTPTGRNTMAARTSAR
jgi:pimeloyl-ACP methyl ester carboxylesterase